MKLEFTLQAAAGSIIGPDGKKDIQYICIYINLYTVHMYIYIHLLGPFGVLNKWKDGILRSESAQRRRTPKMTTGSSDRATPALARCAVFFPEISTGGNTSKSVGGLVLNIPPHESLQVGMRVCFVWFQWNDVGLYTMDFHIWV